MKTALFRVDSSIQIGSGHVIRCLTLANELKEKNWNCIFVSRNHEGNLGKKISASGFELKLLKTKKVDKEKRKNGQFKKRDYSNWLGGNWEEDVEQTIATLNKEKLDLIVVDHYGVDERWERKARKFCKKICAIDDLADRVHDCDFLLDQNLTENMERRYDGKLNSQCKKMIGPKYSLLNPDYLKYKQKIKNVMNGKPRGLVYFGGGDHAELTKIFAKILAEECGGNFVLDLIAQEKKNFQDIDFDKTNLEIIFHKPLKSLAALMAKVQFVIGAGGASSWERIFLGIPSLVVSIAENQTEICEELSRRKLIKFLGKKSHLSSLDLKKEVENFLFFIKNNPVIESELVDGLGVFRVSTVIDVSLEGNLTVRPARRNDESLLLDWVNDPEVRRNSFKSGSISPEEHRHWFNSRLNNKNKTRIFIVNSGEWPVGQVRFDKSENVWLIDYSIDPEFRGMGCGGRILAVAIEAFRMAKIGSCLKALVKPENIRSAKIFERLGFEKSENIINRSQEFLKNI